MTTGGGPAPTKCTVSGGARSTAADVSDMRSTAHRLDTSGDDATSLCGDVARAASHLPLKSAVLSPGSAATIAEEVAGLTIGPNSLGRLAVQMEFVARTVRWSAQAYQLTDEAEQRALAAIQVATAAPHVAMALTVAVAASHGNPKTLLADLEHLAYVDPQLVPAAVTVVRGLVLAGSPALAAVGIDPPAGGSYEQQVAWVNGLANAAGKLDDRTPLTVNRIARRSDTSASDVAGLLRQAREVEAASGDDHSTVQVRRTIGPGGEGAWSVIVPGTSNWSPDEPHSPADLTANVRAAAGLPSSNYAAIESAVRDAMATKGIAPGTEPVMLVGHSQGGLLAMRLAADEDFRTAFDVRQVVTAGSPVSRIEVPDTVQVLSVELAGDPVPKLDGAADPSTINRTVVGCTPPDADWIELFEAHDARRYSDTVAVDGASLAADPGLQRWRDSAAPWLTGGGDVFEYHLRRP